RVMTAVLPGTGADALRAMCDQIKSQQADVVAILAGVTDGKATIAATAGTEAQKLGVHAGKLVGQVAKLAGGNGGGKPDLAMAGAKDPSKLKEALAAANEIIAAMLK
ncbi:MAG: DHHA1 domain-containing protein, partial [Faecalispora jeddahensis]